MTSLYDIKVNDAKGHSVALDQYRGDILLIVNTATRCGLAPQYEGLQKLYETYQDKGFYVLDFPSNQFLQTPENAEEIDAFCTTNYQTTFPRFEKVNVNGKDASPVFKYMRKEKGGILGDAIKWNFTKFLVDQEGNVVKRFSPTSQPSEIENYIQDLLE